MYNILQHGWCEHSVRWCGSLSLGLRSPRWWRAGPPGWSGCCWAHAGRSRLRGCWACGWWPLTPTFSAAPAAPTDLRSIRNRSSQTNCLQINSGQGNGTMGKVQTKWGFIQLTVQEKVCQTWRGTTVHVCGGDAIGSRTVMQFWGGKNRNRHTQKKKRKNQASQITASVNAAMHL